MRMQRNGRLYYYIKVVNVKPSDSDISFVCVCVCIMYSLYINDMNEHMHQKNCLQQQSRAAVRNERTKKKGKIEPEGYPFLCNVSFTLDCL